MLCRGGTVVRSDHWSLTECVTCWLCLSLLPVENCRELYLIVLLQSSPGHHRRSHQLTVISSRISAQARASHSHCQPAGGRGLRKTDRRWEVGGGERRRRPAGREREGLRRVLLPANTGCRAGWLAATSTGPVQCRAMVALTLLPLAAAQLTLLSDWLTHRQVGDWEPL